MPSENGVIAEEHRAPLGHGICRAPSCPIAEEAMPVELYPGPGEYCPECGAVLEPVAALPGVDVGVLPAVEPAAPATPPPAAVDVSAAAATSAPAQTAPSRADHSPPEGTDPSPARAESEPARPESPFRKRVALALGLVAIAAAGGVALVRSLTGHPVASIAVRARPSSAAYPLERAGNGPGDVARTGGVLSSQIASAPKGTIGRSPATRPTPTALPSAQPTTTPLPNAPPTTAPLPSAQPTTNGIATPPPTATPDTSTQRAARKGQSAKQLAVLRDARRPRPAGTRATAIGAIATDEPAQPESTQAGADSLPAASMAVQPAVPLRPTTTPISCARPDTPPAIVSAAAPETPPLAEQQGISGVVHVIVSLNAQNRVVATRIQSSPSVLLNRAALAAARTSQFRTQVVNCEPVAADYVLDVNFTR